MNDATYRTGQAARILNISPHHMRRLCEAGLAEAELTDGNRWRIPASEVERLKREGIPPIPQIEVSERPIRHAPEPAERFSNEGAQVDGPPPFSPEVQAEVDGLAIAERRLKRRKLELEQEDVEDSFRERENRRQAEQQAQQRAAADARERAARKTWLEKWTLFGLAHLKHAFPSASVPGECELAIHAEIASALECVTPDHSEELIRQLTEACVRKVIAPFERREQMQIAVNSAVSRLPSDVVANPTARTKARQLASAAIAKLSELATPDDMRVTARAAVAPVIAEEQHEIQKLSVAAGYWTGYFSATQDEREEARDLARKALESAPIGTTRDHLERLRDRAIAPIVAKIHAREERLNARRNAEVAVSGHLCRVGSYLRENYDFPDVFEKWELERQLKAELQTELIKRLIDGSLAPANIDTEIDDWLDERLEDDEDEEDE